jgi:hypothetical protein
MGDLTIGVYGLVINAREVIVNQGVHFNFHLPSGLYKDVKLSGNI